MGERIPIEIVYATPERQELLAMEVDRGTTAGEAVALSGLKEMFPEMVVDEKALGIFSRKVSPDHVLQRGDRLEIYRPLIADPKESRRQRAKNRARGA